MKLPRSRHVLIASGTLVLVLVGAAAARSEPPPQPSPQAAAEAGKERPRLPVIAAKGPKTRVKGNIVRSSRGRKGPVRLLVERENGSKLTALIAPDEYCEQKGLSLRPGEAVELEGTLLKSERPMLVATAVVVDGRTVQIRDAQGKLVDAGTSGPEGGASAGTKASLSARPAASATPGK